MKSGMRLKPLWAAAALLWAQPTWALDSYRFLHVSIDTPWYIFLFLMLIMFAPFVLMGILVWRYADRRKEHMHAADPGERQP